MARPRASEIAFAFQELPKAPPSCAATPTLSRCRYCSLHIHAQKQAAHLAHCKRYLTLKHQQRLASYHRRSLSPSSSSCATSRSGSPVPGPRDERTRPRVEEQAAQLEKALACYMSSGLQVLENAQEPWLPRRSFGKLSAYENHTPPTWEELAEALLKAEMRKREKKEGGAVVRIDQVRCGMAVEVVCEKGRFVFYWAGTKMDGFEAWVVELVAAVVGECAVEDAGVWEDVGVLVSDTGMRVKDACARVVDEVEASDEIDFDDEDDDDTKVPDLL